MTEKSDAYYVTTLYTTMDLSTFNKIRCEGENVLYMKKERYCCRYYIEGDEHLISKWKDEIFDEYPPCGYGTSFTQVSPTKISVYRFLTCD